jgi:DNA-binding NarL/FixJ family response regulator
MSKIKVLLADDHTLVREGLRSLLDNFGFCEVVAEASDGAEALERIRQYLPDVVLMDVAMKEMSGLDAAARAKQEFPHLQIIMLSMYADEEYVARALRAGASGYMLKDAAKSELESAINAVLKGDVYLSPAISKLIAASYVRGAEATDSSGALPPRQREILVLIAEGLSTKEIAYQLGVSPKTVETHRARLMERLEIHDVAGLVKYAIRSGLVKPEK